MILGLTTTSLKMITGSAGDVSAYAMYADYTTAPTFDEADQLTASVVTATTTIIVAAPTGSIKRQVKSLMIRNNHASIANLVTIQVVDSVGPTNITVFKINLVAGASLNYDGFSWVPYDANGFIVSSQAYSAQGSDTQTQINDGGFTAGALNYRWDKSTNTLYLDGADTEIDLKGVTNEASNPAAGFVRLYSRVVAGKPMLKYIGERDLDVFTDSSAFSRHRAEFTCGVAAGAWTGTTGTNLGTPTLSIPALGSIGAFMRRSVFPSVVTTTNQQVGTRTDAMLFRGNATGQGGFFIAARIVFHTWTTGNRLFIGACVDTTAIVTGDPSSKLNLCGFGVDAADTAITFMHNDGSGTATKDAIGGQPALATNNAYLCIIYCKPNDSVVYYALYNLTSGANSLLIDASASTDLPVNTTALVGSFHMGNAANIVAGNASLGVNRIVIDTDF